MTVQFPKLAITGGAGYVGSVLTPYLMSLGYNVTVIDTFWYGDHLPEAGPKLRKVRGDIRDEIVLDRGMQGADAVIHLACISNDPSFELDPALGKSINYDAFFGLLRALRANRIKRFIYASSSSVYGVKSEPNVREDSSCEPLTEYSRYKYLCEKALKETGIGSGEYVVLRPATACGDAPRLRLDLIVNILTIHALARKRITVFGGDQLRPSINIKDVVEAYRMLLEAPGEKVHGQTFNVGYENMAVSNVAELIRSKIADPEVTVAVEPTNDHRSYHINSDKFRDVLGFEARHTIEDAIESIHRAYREGRIPDPLTDPRYYNIRVMQRYMATAKEGQPAARQAGFGSGG